MSRQPAIHQCTIALCNMLTFRLSANMLLEAYLGWCIVYLYGLQQKLCFMTKLLVHNGGENTAFKYFLFGGDDVRKTLWFIAPTFWSTKLDLSIKYSGSAGVIWLVLMKCVVILVNIYIFLISRLALSYIHHCCDLQLLVSMVIFQIFCLLVFMCSIHVHTLQHIFPEHIYFLVCSSAIHLMFLWVSTAVEIGVVCLQSCFFPRTHASKFATRAVEMVALYYMECIHCR